MILVKLTNRGGQMDVVEFIHPEIVLGKRRFPGISEEYDDLSDSLISALERDDESLSLHYRLATVYQGLRNESPAIYINEVMVKILASIDKNIPTQFLPERTFAYVQFPEGVLNDGEDDVIGAYYYIGTGDDLCLRGKFQFSRIFLVSYVCRGLLSRGSLLIDLIDSKRLSEIMDDYPHEQMSIGSRIERYDISAGLLKKRETIFRVLINLILLIEARGRSPNDHHLIHLYPSMKMPTNKKLHKIRRDRSQKGIYNLSSIPLLFLDGNDLKSMVQRSGDGMFVGVSGHFRWQPYGTERKLLKLIWINEHHRTYTKQSVINNFKENLGSQSDSLSN